MQFTVEADDRTTENTGDVQIKTVDIQPRKRAEDDMESAPQGES